MSNDNRFPIYLTAEQARTIERALMKLDAQYTEKMMEYADPSMTSTLAKMRERVRQTSRAFHE